TVDLKVRMCCTGCERVVKNAIRKLRGIDSVEVDLEMEKVRVIGYVDRNKVLKAVRRAGKRAEFWPYPNPPLYFTSSSHYFKDMTSEYKESYNYWRHGYNTADRHGSLHVTHRGDDKVSNFFNDDNVNACRLMSNLIRVEVVRHFDRLRNNTWDLRKEQIFRFAEKPPSKII
ncbi:UNVERIFIED_CONTAM: Heavy metal-associated isoprenylated plant protein 44, partial [Sesamum indicum]